jgi:hypothetical protein
VSYREGKPLAGIMDGAFGVAWSDTVLVAVPGYPWMRLMTDFTTTADSFVVPQTRRRGVPIDLAGRLLAAPDFPAMFSVASHLFGVHRLPDGELIFIYYDQDFEKTITNVRVWLTVINAARSQACVDALVPTSGEVQPRTTVIGDTLFVLDQKVSSDSALITTITSYRIDTGFCDWVPVL